MICKMVLCKLFPSIEDYVTSKFINAVKIRYDVWCHIAQLNLYPRLSFGHRVLSIPACVSVCQSRTYLHDNLCPVQSRITKFGQEGLNTLVKIPIVLVGD